MKKISIILSVVLMIFISSCKSNTADIKISCPTLTDSTEVYLAKLVVNQIVLTDTLYVHNFKCSSKINCVEDCPEFYYVYTSDKILGSMILLPGDKIAVKPDKENKYHTTGSQETKLLQDVERRFQDVNTKFHSLSQELVAASDAKNIKEEEKVKKELIDLYVNYKKESIKFLINNPTSITSIYVLYQNIADRLPVFNSLNDAIYFQKVYDSLRNIYPNSPLIASLADDGGKRMNMLKLQQGLNNAKVVAFPEIELNDIYGHSKKLSDLKGKVFLLSFWTVTENTQKLYNHELLKIYDKYSDKGFEIYQVSFDSDKTMWAQIVKDQNLPWISVQDTESLSSSVLKLYNVKKIPSIFLFNKEGDIIMKNDFDLKKLDREIKRVFSY